MKINPIIPSTIITLKIAIMMELVFLLGPIGVWGGLVGAEIGGVSGSCTTTEGSAGAGACLIGCCGSGVDGIFSMLLIF